MKPNLTICGVDKYPTPSDPALYLIAELHQPFANKDIIKLDPDDYIFSGEKETLAALEKYVSGGVWTRRAFVRVSLEPRQSRYIVLYVPEDTRKLVYHDMLDTGIHNILNGHK